MTAETLPPDAVLVRALQWARRIVGRAVEIDRTLEATSSVVLALRSEGGHRLVLRLFTNRRWLATEPDLASHESAALERVAVLPFPTPELVGCDAEGEHAGMPAVLMRRLDGRVGLPAVPGPAWLGILAEIPICIAALEDAGFPWRYEPWLLDPLPLPHGNDLWERAAQVVASGLPASRQVFLHRDHHPMNVLFAGRALSGVVDWVNACVGPEPVDVAHCRVNLAAMYGVSTADAFRTEWSRLSGRSYDPTWDLVTLLSMLPLAPYGPWADAGLEVPHSTLRRRLETLARRSLHELGL